VARPSCRQEKQILKIVRGGGPERSLGLLLAVSVVVPRLMP
jgi:hypothetical protein